MKTLIFLLLIFCAVNVSAQCKSDEEIMNILRDEIGNCARPSDLETRMRNVIIKFAESEERDRFFIFTEDITQITDSDKDVMFKMLEDRRVLIKELMGVYEEIKESEASQRMDGLIYRMKQVK